MELQLDRVSKRFQTKIAVDRVSLSMGEGLYGLLGANGAGKTTLMRMMAGILKPDAGEIRLGGREVSSKAYRELLGYLPQEFGYYPSFTAKDFLLYLAALKGVPKAKAREKAGELLELVNLTEYAGKKIKTFSGGMKQRLGIAQALLNHPKLLILDEPTAGLDPKERVKFRNLISSLKKDRIVLLSTHIVSDIEYIADEVLIMKNGAVLHQGEPKRILEVIEGKVWECFLTREELFSMEQEFAILNLREEGSGIFVRAVGERCPKEGARVVPATLEDLYLYYFNEQQGGMG